MITVYLNDKDIFRMCADNEEILSLTPNDFFKKELDKLIKDGVEIFFNNLSFWGLAFFKAISDLGYTDASTDVLTDSNRKLARGEFSYVVSSQNSTFYNIRIKHGKKETKIFEFKNLIPVDMDDLMEEFGGEECVAMHRSIMDLRELGVRRSTISSTAYQLWKNGFDRGDFSRMFKENDEVVEKICRDAYHGGICMLNSRETMHGKGVVLDVNSLYAYIMKTCKFPTGAAHYGKGFIPEEIENSDDISFYVKFKAKFELKKDHIPFVRTRCDKRHWSLETLSTSNYIDLNGVEYEYVESPGSKYVDEWGEIHFDVEPVYVELCMYKAEYELFFEQYDVKDVIMEEYVWWWNSGYVFNIFVDRFYSMKKNAKTKAERRIAKMILNALTGRMSLKKERENHYFDKRTLELLDMVGEVKMDNLLKDHRGKKDKMALEDSISTFSSGVFETESDSDSHVEIGAAITSEAMCFIVRKAQKNYKNFLYTDTDSLHLKGTIDDVVDVEIGDDLGQFKVEHTYDFAMYLKEKVYILADKDKTYHMTFAGLPRECQRVYERLMLSYMPEYADTITPADILKENSLLWKYIEENIIYKEITSKDFVDRLFGSQLWSKTKDGGIFFSIDGAEIPRIVRKISSYKNYEIEKKLNWYRIDISKDMR